MRLRYDQFTEAGLSSPFHSPTSLFQRKSLLIAYSHNTIISGIQSKRPIVKTSHGQNVPYSKRPHSKRPLFEAKRPRRSKRPKSKRTDVMGSFSHEIPMVRQNHGKYQLSC